MADSVKDVPSKKLLESLHVDYVKSLDTVSDVYSWQTPNTGALPGDSPAEQRLCALWRTQGINPEEALG
jgi:hypothetical protein